MALDLSGWTTAEIEKFEHTLKGKFNGMRDVIAHSIGSSIQQDDPFLPIDNEDFSGEDRYFVRFDEKMGTSEYKVFKHNVSTPYIALPNFSTNFKFTPIIRQPGESLTGKIESLNSDDFIFAADAMFHKWALGLVPEGIQYQSVTQVYKDGSAQFSANDIEFDSGKGSSFIRWDSGSNALSFDTVSSISDPGGTNSIGSFIEGVNGNEVFLSQYVTETLAESGIGKSFFAYHSTRDLLLAIVQPHAGILNPVIDVEADKLLNSLRDFGFDHVMVLDGSDSVFLRECKGTGNGRWLVNSLGLLKNDPFGGMLVAYGVERL